MGAPKDSTASAPYIPYTQPLDEYTFRVYYPAGLLYGGNDSARLDLKANKSLWIVHKFYAKLIAIIRMIDNIIMISIAGDMTIGCIVWSYLVYGLERLLH